MIMYEVSGLDGMVDAMESVNRMPDSKTAAKFEAWLMRSFAATQANVHVISGRLKASGNTDAEMKGNVWSGEISYGGSSGSPAFYAIYEMNRSGVRFGTPHDFFSGLEAFDPMFEAAIDFHFREL